MDIKLFEVMKFLILNNWSLFFYAIKILIIKNNFNRLKYCFSCKITLLLTLKIYKYVKRSRRKKGN